MGFSPSAYLYSRSKTQEEFDRDRRRERWFELLFGIGMASLAVLMIMGMFWAGQSAASQCCAKWSEPKQVQVCHGGGLAWGIHLGGGLMLPLLGGDQSCEMKERQECVAFATGPRGPDGNSCLNKVAP
jgi:hypothetical protein